MSMVTSKWFLIYVKIIKCWICNYCFPWCTHATQISTNRSYMYTWRKKNPKLTPIIALSPQKLMTFLSVSSYGVLLHGIITRFKDTANEPFERTGGSSASRTWRHPVCPRLPHHHSPRSVRPRREQSPLLWDRDSRTSGCRSSDQRGTSALEELLKLHVNKPKPQHIPVLIW